MHEDGPAMVVRMSHPGGLVGRTLCPVVEMPISRFGRCTEDGLWWISHGLARSEMGVCGLGGESWWTR